MDIFPTSSHSVLTMALWGWRCYYYSHPRVWENLGPYRLGNTSKGVQPCRLSEKPALLITSVFHKEWPADHICQNVSTPSFSPNSNLLNQMAVVGNSGSPGVWISISSTVDSHGCPSLRTKATLPNLSDAFCQKTGKEGSSSVFNSKCIFGVTVDKKSQASFPSKFAE